jgi:hypothetical protein
MGEACSKPSLSMAFSSSGERPSSEKSLDVIKSVSATGDSIASPGGGRELILPRQVDGSGKEKEPGSKPNKKPGSSTQTHVLTINSTGAGEMCSKNLRFFFSRLMSRFFFKPKRLRAAAAAGGGI